MDAPIPPPPSGTATRPRRRGWLLAALALLLLGGVLAWQLALRELQRSVAGALGPRGTVGAVGLSWNGVELLDLRIAAAPRSGWPAADELRARRVLVTPDPWALLWGRAALSRVRVEDGYIALLRGRDGRLRVLPALLDDAARQAGAASPTAAADAPRGLQVGTLELVATEVAFFDASVRRPPLALRLTGIEARIGPLALPGPDRATRIDLQATVKGPRRDGRLQIAGEFTAATRDADLQITLRGVDLVALQPYLGRVSDGGVRRGTLDLDMRPTVKNQQLRAPGRMTLTGLELGSGGLAGVPRQAVLAFMTNNDRIELDFTLEGRLDDPAFSLNENVATRFASALAGKLGVSLGGVVEGVGGVIRGLFGR